MAQKEIQLANQADLNAALARIKALEDKPAASGGGLGSIEKSAAAHNALYGGRDLTSKYSIGKLCEMIAAGTFDDIFPGDYFTKNITVAGVTETVDFMFADLDTFFKNGDTALTRHHATIIPKDCFKTTQQMNTSHTTSGGYKGSKMHTSVLPTYIAAIKAAFKNEGHDGHVLSWRSLLSNSMSTSLASMAGAGYTGASNGWEWTSVEIRLLSEIQLYGSTVFSSSFYDVGEANTQFAVFRHNPALKIAGLGKNGDRQWWWLSAVAASTSFAYCNHDGRADVTDAGSSYGVRPYFLIG